MSSPVVKCQSHCMLSRCIPGRRDKEHCALLITSKSKVSRIKSFRTVQISQGRMIVGLFAEQVAPEFQDQDVLLASQVVQACDKLEDRGEG